MRGVAAVFRHQFNKFRRDKIQLAVFILWPVLAIALVIVSMLGFGEPNQYEHPGQIALGIGVMIAGGYLIGFLFAPVMAENRESGHLFSVKLPAYLLGAGGFYVLLTTAVATIIALIGGLRGVAFAYYLLILLLSLICTALIGSIIGLLAKSPQWALRIGLPIGVAFGLLLKVRNGVPIPMLARVQPFIDWLYTEGLNNMLIEVHTGDIVRSVLVILGNIAVLAIIFGIVYILRRKQFIAKKDEV
ncbi:MAG: hypothetical protein FWE40_10210 [Oscillospiraceae bacterium]|nr:hypothetical protein [Oscillospiraceae bacterium]